MELLTKWIALLTAVVSLVTAGASYWKSRQNEKAIDAIKNCRGEVALSIDTPTEGAHVASLVEVSGRSTIHEACRYVCIVLHDVSTPGKGWQIADLTQVNTTGRWGGRVSLESVALGSDVEIDARVNSRPNACVIDQQRSIPVEEGVPSNIVRIRRVR